MATKAPRPGVTERAEASSAAQQILTIPYDDFEYTLAWRNLPMPERVLVRKATGLPYEAYTQQLADTEVSVIGEDSLCVLWWLARRRNGEWQLTWAKAAEEWDMDKLGLVQVDDPNPQATDPEA